MAAAFALLAAAAWGCGVFLGGLATRRASLAAVLRIDLVVGTVVVLPFSILMAESFSVKDLFIGAVSGLFGLLGVAFFYLGLRGPMASVAPTSGVTMALVAFLWGVVFGEQLSVWQLTGIALGLTAIILVSIPPRSTERVALVPVLHGLLSGLAFGVALVVMDATNPSTAPWPVFGSRILPVLLLLLVTARSKPSLSSSENTRLLAIGAGLLNVLGAVAYLAALNRGLLSISSVLSSLHPAVTVILAKTILRERISGGQVVGLVFGVGAISLITTG